MSCFEEFNPVVFLPADSSASYEMERFRGLLSKLDDEQLIEFSKLAQKQMQSIMNYLRDIIDGPEERAKDKPKGHFWIIYHTVQGLNLIDQLIREPLAKRGIWEW